MTVTIQLPPEAEQRLREKAAQEGVPVEAVAAGVLTRALEWEVLDSAEAAEGIQRGLHDFQAGRFRSFAEFAAEQRRKHGTHPQR